jgi:hypothetical protein
LRSPTSVKHLRYTHGKSYVSKKAHTLASKLKEHL